MDRPGRGVAHLFSRILIRLIRLDVGVLQGVEVAEPVGRVLELVAEPQEFEPIALQLAGQPRRRRALGEAAEDQQQRDRPPLRAPQLSAGEGVEGAPTRPATIVEDRGPVASVDVCRFSTMTARAGQAPGMQPLDQLIVASLLVHQFGDREVHDGHPLGSGG